MNVWMFCAESPAGGGAEDQEPLRDGGPGAPQTAGQTRTVSTMISLNCSAISYS